MKQFCLTHVWRTWRASKNSEGASLLCSACLSLLILNVQLGAFVVARGRSPQATNKIIKPIVNLRAVRASNGRLIEGGEDLFKSFFEASDGTTVTKVVVLCGSVLRANQLLEQATKRAKAVIRSNPEAP
jgi:hypothetical protein